MSCCGNCSCRRLDLDALAASYQDLGILSERLITEQDVAAALDTLDYIRDAMRAYLDEAQDR